MANPSPDPTPLVIAWQWATRIMTVAIEMVAPGIVGYWIDQQLNTRVVFILLGFALGVSFGVWHLIRMTTPRNSIQRDTPRDESLKHLKP